MDQLHALRVFTCVAELASFSRAAERLGLPKASVSSYVQQLEAEFGSRLLQRTTRRVSLTADGELCYRRGKALLEEFENLRAQFAPDDAGLRGTLRIDMPGPIARQWVLPRLIELLDRNPELNIEISGTDHRVDLVAEGIDCVLRIGSLQTSSLVARPLGRMRQISVASPAYLARHGEPHTLHALTRHQLVRYQGNDRFEYLDPDSGTPCHLSLPGQVGVGNTSDYLAAGLAGLGIIQLPRYGVLDRLARGELIELLPQWAPPPLPVTLLYAHRRQLPPRSRVFMNWLEDLLRPLLQEG
jgi:DNA-binding transcriptional LysR family regulator